jgi:hypothetical protein
MASPPLDVVSVDDARQARASSPNKSRTGANNLVRAARWELEKNNGSVTRDARQTETMMVRVHGSTRELGHTSSHTDQKASVEITSPPLGVISDR